MGTEPLKQRKLSPPMSVLRDISQTQMCPTADSQTASESREWTWRQQIGVLLCSSKLRGTVATESLTHHVNSALSLNQILRLTATTLFIVILSVSLLPVIVVSLNSRITLNKTLSFAEYPGRSTPAGGVSVGETRNRIAAISFEVQSAFEVLHEPTIGTAYETPN